MVGLQAPRSRAARPGSRRMPSRHPARMCSTSGRAVERAGGVAHRRQVADLGERHEPLVGRVLRRGAVEEVRVLDRRQPARPRSCESRQKRSRREIIGCRPRTTRSSRRRPSLGAEGELRRSPRRRTPPRRRGAAPRRRHGRPARWPRLDAARPCRPGRRRLAPGEVEVDHAALGVREAPGSEAAATVSRTPRGRRAPEGRHEAHVPAGAAVGGGGELPPVAR